MIALSSFEVDRIDWYSQDSYLLLNPRLSSHERQRFESLYERFSKGLPRHFWLATSGTTSKGIDDLKLVALSKSAVLASAESVNRHLQVDSNDCWLLSLPIFHVGGLGILARSHLMRKKIVHLPQWKPEDYCQTILKNKITLSALVPTQIYDLVESNLKAPTSLKAIVVGGAALSPDLYRKARELNWPCLPSYGMSECASQVATASLDSLRYSDFPDLEILKHIQLKADDNQRFCIKSLSLFSGYAFMQDGKPQFSDPKVDGWFLSQDFGQLLENGYIKVLGRSKDFIKIGGEKVCMPLLRQKLQYLIGEKQAYLLAVPDVRLGQVIHLVSLYSVDLVRLKEIEEKFNAQVMPFEQIRMIHQVQEFPYTDLGKIRENDLLTLVQSQE